MIERAKRSVINSLDSVASMIISRGSIGIIVL